MVAPRKYRNIEERTFICDEVLQKIESLPLTDPELVEIKKVLDTFQQQVAGITLSGTIDLSSIDCVLKYELPGRRIMRHFMKLEKKEQVQEVQDSEVHH